MTDTCHGPAYEPSVHVYFLNNMGIVVDVLSKVTTHDNDVRAIIK